MKKLILPVITLSVLSLSVIGCGFHQNTAALDNNGVVVTGVNYQGKVIKDRDLVLYRKNPNHVFVYDNVKYRVKPYQNTYVYYRI